MIRGTGIILTFISAIFFPWLFTVFLVLGVSIFEPLTPLAVGVFVDAVYYIPNTGVFLLFTIYGLVVTVIMFLVRSRLKTGIIGK